MCNKGVHLLVIKSQYFNNNSNLHGFKCTLFFFGVFSLQSVKDATMEMKYGMCEGAVAIRKGVQRGFHCQGAMCGNAAFYLEL
jgi:hypothetical protein